MSDLAVQTKLARVVHVSDTSHIPTEIVINRGATDGVKRGDRYLVFGEGPDIIDPDTGKSLGRVELVRGRGEVVHVQEHMATIRSLEKQKERPVKRIVHQGMSGGSLSIYLSMRPGKTIEEELEPETILPFDHVCLGDQAKPI